MIVDAYEPKGAGVEILAARHLEPRAPKPWRTAAPGTGCEWGCLLKAPLEGASIDPKP